MMSVLESSLSTALNGKELKSADLSLVIESADNFSYTDPIDGSVAKNQVFRTHNFRCNGLWRKLLIIR